MLTSSKRSQTAESQPIKERFAGLAWAWSLDLVGELPPVAFLSVCRRDRCSLSIDVLRRIGSSAEPAGRPENQPKAFPGIRRA